MRRGLQDEGGLSASLYVYRSDLRVYLLGALQFVLHGIQGYTTCSALTVIMRFVTKGAKFDLDDIKSFEEIYMNVENSCVVLRDIDELI